MTNDTTAKDSMKIKMDTYTKQLYEDFVSALSDRLRDTADSTASQLGQINKSLDALRDQVKEPKEVLLKHIDDLVSQLNNIVKEHDNNLLSVAKRSEVNRDEVLQAISTSETSEIERTKMACKDVIDKVDASTKMLSDQHNELLQTLNSLHEELITRHQDLSEKNDALTEQVKTNQELLIWILTPWYRKIFRRKNGKPQILAKKPVAESEDN